MKTTIVKWGNSQGVRLPKHLLESANINEQDTLEIVTEKQSIIIKKCTQPSYKSIRERFQGFSEPYEEEMVDWGRPMGKEIW